MSNVSRPAGLIPVKHGAGGTPNRLGAYTIASGLAENIFEGSVVTMTGTGRNIALAPPGNDQRVLGAFAGVKFTAADGSVVFSNRWVSGTVLQAGTVAEALVYDDPSQQFVIQVDGAGLAAADIGSQANIIAESGTPVTGRSTQQLGIASASNSAGRMFRIIGLAPIPENDYGVSAKALVTIRSHALLTAAGFNAV